MNGGGGMNSNLQIFGHVGLSTITHLSIACPIGWCTGSGQGFHQPLNSLPRGWVFDLGLGETQEDLTHTLRLFETTRVKLI